MDKPATTAQNTRDVDRAMALMANAVGMTPVDVLRRPYEARDRWKRIEAAANKEPAHSLESGHKPVIDYAAIYARQNGSKERHA